MPSSSRSATSPVSSQPSRTPPRSPPGCASSRGRRWARGRAAPPPRPRSRYRGGPRDVRVRLARVPDLAPRILRRQAEHVRGGLGEPVALHDVDTARGPDVEQRLRHRSAADDGEPEAREVGLGEAGLLRHEEVGRRDAHHRRHPLRLDHLQRARGVERRLEHDRRPLPPREDRLHVPAADVELRQHLQDDVVVPKAGRQVEGEVRPEAVRVREQRALRLPGRARGVDQQQRVVVARDVGDLAVGLEGGIGELRDPHRPPGSVRKLLVLRGREQQRRRRVVQLVGDLCRREPPRDRLQGDTGLAQANISATWSRELPVSVETRSPRLRPRAVARRRAASRAARAPRR